MIVTYDFQYRHSIPNAPNPLTLPDLEDEDETAEERDARLLESLKSSSSHGQVTLNEEEQLVWPVRLLYPEYATSDIIQQFSEVECGNLSDLFF